MGIYIKTMPKIRIIEITNQPTFIIFLTLGSQSMLKYYHLLQIFPNIMRGVKTKENSKWKRLSIGLVLLVVLAFLLNSVSKVYNKKEEAQKVLSRMEEEKAKLEKRSQFLKESLAKLQTRGGLDFEIRRKLNVAEVGESVAIIVEEENSTTPPTPSASFWQKFKNFFIEWFK